MNARSAIVLGMLALGGADGTSAAAKLLSEADLDVTIVNDGPVTGFYGGAGGDMDGDGFDDLILLTNDGSRLTAWVFPGGNPLSRWLLSKARRIDFPAPPVKFPTTGSPYARLADWDGDGRADLFVSMPARREVWVIAGRSLSFAALDLTTAGPDRRLTATTGFHVSGDFNGDGVVDVVFGDASASPFGRTGAGAAYLFFGRAAIPFVSTAAASGNVSFWGPGASAGLAGWGGGPDVRTDLNGDGIDDFVTSHTLSSMTVFFGRAQWPSSWDLATRPADRTVSVQIFLGRGWPAGDVTKNGRGDFYIGGGNYPSGLLEGGQLMAANGTLSISQASPAYRFAGYRSAYGSMDFDGDRFPDMVLGVPEDSAQTLGFHLSRWWSDGVSPSTPPVMSTLVNRPMIASGDFNGDGFEDAVLAEGSDLNVTNSEWTGRLQILHGHIPLRDARLNLASAAVASNWVRASLEVEGEPVEMSFRGDVAASLVDRWIPYESSYMLELSGEAGPKSVRVAFRNAQKKESDEATAGVSVVPGDAPAVQTYRNRVRSGTAARWDVTLPRGGLIRARVFGAVGTEVRTLMEESRGPGAWPVEWDGRNVAGQLVSPGHYRVRIETDGTDRILDVVVER